MADVTWTSALTITQGNATKKSEIDAAFNNTKFIQNKGSDIASDTTTDIGAAGGLFVDVTGTTTITGLGTIAAGQIRFVRFTGALILTHNATSLILPGAANWTTAAGDCFIFESLGSGNWQCVGYMLANGKTIGGVSNNTISQAMMLDSAIGQAELKQGNGSVNTTDAGGNLTLPGGVYGFYPQFKGAMEDARFVLNKDFSTTYTTNIYLKATTGNTVYAQHYYVTASGEQHWVFLLKNKISGKIISSWQSAEHVCFGHAHPALVPHPFGNYDPAIHEIIVWNPTLDEVAEMMERAISDPITGLKLGDLSGGSYLDNDIIVYEDANGPWMRTKKEIIDLSKVEEIHPDVRFTVIRPDRCILQVMREEMEIDDVEKTTTPWVDAPVTIGLPKKHDGQLVDWRMMPAGTKVKPLKMRIPRPGYIEPKKMVYKQ